MRRAMEAKSPILKGPGSALDALAEQKRLHDRLRQLAGKRGDDATVATFCAN